MLRFVHRLDEAAHQHAGDHDHDAEIPEGEEVGRIVEPRHHGTVAEPDAQPEDQHGEDRFHAEVRTREILDIERDHIEEETDQAYDGEVSIDTDLRLGERPAEAAGVVDDRCTAEEPRCEEREHDVERGKDRGHAYQEGAFEVHVGEAEFRKADHHCRKERDLQALVGGALARGLCPIEGGAAQSKTRNGEGHDCEPEVLVCAAAHHEDRAVEERRVECDDRGAEAGRRGKIHLISYRVPARPLEPRAARRTASRSPARGRVMMHAMLLLALALAVAASYALSRIFLGYPRPASRPVWLSRRELAVVDAAAETLFPLGGAIPLSGREAQIPAFVDSYVAAVPRNLRILMRMLLFLVEHATVFFPASGGLLGGAMRRFSCLSPEQRVAALTGWEHSSLFARRLVFTSLRAILTMGYLSSPGVLRALGLAPREIPTPICEADLLYPRVGALPSTIALRAADL